MKISYFPYEIESTWHGQAHAGALVRVELEGGKCGYSDLHPWPELGDPTLQECLRALANNYPILPIVMRMSKIAMLDADARARDLSLARGCEVPRSHKLIANLDTVTTQQLEHWVAAGYSHVKVKMGRDLRKETERLKFLVGSVPLQWRLDFNGRVNQADLSKWWGANEKWLRGSLDGIEDPESSGQAQLPNLQVFWDRVKSEQTDSQGIVWKPEVSEEPGRDRTGPLWVTNNLGHPFGHAVAMTMAARIGHSEVSGLQGLEEYRPNEWTEAIRYHGPSTLPPAGLGFGFDRQLARLKWRNLE